MNAAVPVVAGHAVRGPLLVTFGGGSRWMAYACAADALAVCALRSRRNGAISADDFDFVDSVRIVPLPDAQRLSVLHLHPSNDLLCVGTSGDGLYVTAAAAPVLRVDATRLPLRATGEDIFSACFVRGGGRAGPDVLVISSAFREFGRNGARLSVWDVARASLLWRGCADAAVALAALPAPLSFAAATRRAVALWFAETRDNAALTVRSRPCGAVAELRGAEFVSLAAPDTDKENERESGDRDNGDKERERESGDRDKDKDKDKGKEKGDEESGGAALTALTAGGFLVAFDCRTGAARRWMDCRVCPAASVARAPGGLLVCGALARLFAADSWEFRGKLAPLAHAHEVGDATARSSVLSRIADSVCCGVACGEHGAALFCAGGDAARFRLRATEKKSSARWAFDCTYRYTAPAPGEEPLRFFLAQENTGGGVCLWSPQRVRRFDAALRPGACVKLDTTCAAHHTALGVLALYDAAHYEVVALPLSLRAELCRVAVSEPLVSLAADGRDRFVGLSPDGCLFRLAGEWAGERFALRTLPPQRLAAHTSSAPLLHLATVNDTLFAASARAVFRIDGNREVPVDLGRASGTHSDHGSSDEADNVLALVSAADALLIVRHRSCTLLEKAAASFTSVDISVPAPVFAVRNAVPAVAARVVALCGEAEVAVVRIDDGACVWRRAVSECRAAQLSPNARTIILCDAGGTVAAWPLPAFPNAQKAPRNQSSFQEPRHERHAKQHSRHPPRARSCGGPTTDELQLHYRDLRGFYETTRRERPASSSGVLMLPRGDSILELPPAQASLRRWESAGAPTEIPQALAFSAEKSTAASTVHVSALTSVESHAPRGFFAAAESRSAADMTPSLAAEIITQDRAKVTFAETPAFGVRSPARKGASARCSPERLPEDDVVNIDSFEDIERRGNGARGSPARHADPFLATPQSVASASSARERSFGIRNGLRELAELCERQAREEEDFAPGENAIDEEAVEDLFASVSRLYAVLQLRQSRQKEQQRPESVRSNVSDTSVLSMNMMLTELQRMQLQNSRIESQNKEILSKLREK